jgi:hypothetical protein
MQPNAQVRVAELLSSTLRTYRHDDGLELQLPWRPLFDLLLSLYDVPTTPHYRGSGLRSVQQSTLFTLATRCRRFFAPGAAAEIWALLRPALVHGDPMATRTHLALGWLVLFFPTKQLPHTAPEQAQVCDPPGALCTSLRPLVLGCNKETHRGAVVVVCVILC